MSAARYTWCNRGLRAAFGIGVAFGKHSEGGRKVFRVGSRLELRDAWRTRTTSGKMFSGSALGDTCHLPKGLREGVLRAGFRKGASGRLTPAGGTGSLD